MDYFYDPVDNTYWLYNKELNEWQVWNQSFNKYTKTTIKPDLNRLQQIETTNQGAVVQENKVATSTTGDIEKDIANMADSPFTPVESTNTVIIDILPKGTKKDSFVASQGKKSVSDAKDLVTKWYYTDDPKYQDVVKATGTSDLNANVSIWNRAVDVASITGNEAFRVLNDKKFKKSVSGTAGPTTQVQVSLTSPQDAKLLLDKYFKDFGIPQPPSEEDYNNFVNELNTFERDNATQTRYVTGAGRTVATTTGGVSNEDRERIALQYAVKRLPGDLSKAGGVIGSNLNTLRQLTNAYGVSLDDATLKQYAIDGVTSKSALEDARNRIKGIAKATYRGLASYIDEGLTVEDIASQYKSLKAQLLELNPASINLKDSDIYSAISANQLPSLYDFGVSLRKNPQWQYTQNARQQASKYALTVLSDFGLV